MSDRGHELYGSAYPNANEMTESDRNTYNRLTKSFDINNGNSLDDLAQVSRISLA